MQRHKPMECGSSAAALVTGASGGIGAAIAEKLAAKGRHLVISARGAEALEEKARLWRERYGVEVLVCAADLTRLEDLDRLWRSAMGWCGERGFRLGILVNNAGFGAFGPDWEIDEERLAEMTRLNVEALMRLTHRAALLFREQGGGRILNVASTAAFQSIPYLAHYSATKAYVLSYSEALAVELKAAGVEVVCLCPGPTRTGFSSAAGLKPDSLFDRYAGDVEAVARTAMAQLESGRTVAIVGAVNKLGAWASKFSPRCLTRILTGWVFRRMK